MRFSLCAVTECEWGISRQKAGEEREDGEEDHPPTSNSVKNFKFNQENQLKISFFQKT